MAANNWKRLAVLAVLMVGICFCSACSAVPPVQDNLRFPEITAPELTERETFMVEFGDISTPISGTCELIFPMEEQLCYPYTGARVVAIHVAVGQQVQKGDVLMTLSVNDHQVTLATLRLERERLDQQIGEQKSVLLAQIDEKLQQAQQLGDKRERSPDWKRNCCRWTMMRMHSMRRTFLPRQIKKSHIMKNLRRIM